MQPGSNVRVGDRGGQLALSSALGQVKSSKELLPKYIDQDAKQGPSNQFAERAGSGLRAVLQQQEAAWAECTCAGARISIFLSFSVARVLSPASLTQRDESKRIEVQCRVSVNVAPP